MDEYLDVQDDHGQKTGEIQIRSKVHEQGLWHSAVVCFILNKQNHILLQKRHPNKKLWANMWGVSCGGHVESGDSYKKTAVKEAKEELGIDIKESQLVYIGEAKSEIKNNNIDDKMYNVYYVAKLDIDKSDLVLQKSEVTDAKFIKINELKEMMKDYTDLTPIIAFDYLVKYI